MLEIGAGTGVLTRLLAQRVAHVTAVEPDDRMRAVLRARDAGVEVLAGHAEELPAADVVVRRGHRRLGVALGRRGAGRPRGGPGAASLRAALARLERARPLRRLDALALGRRHHLQPRGAGRRGRAAPAASHASTSTVGGQSPFLEPETALFRWNRPMTKSDLVALATTYSAVITMEEDDRRQHLDAMTRFLDEHEAFVGHGRHRRPHALVLLAGDQALTCTDAACGQLWTL